MMTMLTLSDETARKLIDLAHQEQNSLDDLLDKLIAHYLTHPPQPTPSEVMERLRATGRFTFPPESPPPPPFTPDEERALIEEASRIPSDKTMAQLIIEERQEGW